MNVVGSITAADDLVQVAREGAIQIIRMNRVDKKNALTQPMYEVMANALNSANADSEIRATIILGQPGVFTAGNDLNDFMAFAMTGRLGTHVNRFLHALVDNLKPLVAAVDGVAVGVGTTMLLHCDYVLVSERARLSTPFVNLGLVPEAASSLLGPRVLGPRHATELLVMGRVFDGEKACASGIANELVASDLLETRAIAIAQEFAAKPVEALAIARRLVRGDTQAIKARMDEESALFGQRLGSAEARAAFTAFLSKKG